MKHELLFKCFPSFENNLILDIEKFGIIKKYIPNEITIKQGQLLQHLPLVVDGMAKAISVDNDLQFLLYYLSKNKTCIFSFAHLFSQQPVEFSVISETHCTVILLPIQQVREWLVKYPTFNEFILKEHQRQYDDLLQTAKAMICYNLEDRLMSYFKKRVELSNSNILPISHQYIANDLATTREVISRLMIKLVKDNKVQQIGRKIKIL